MATRREREKREERRASAGDWAKQSQSGFGPTHLNLPEGVELYKLELGTHVVDFLPYLVGENHPRADEGFEHFTREYVGHRIPGMDGRTRLYCCRSKCFNQPCPACRLANNRDTSKEIADALKPTSRMLWIVNDKPGDTRNPLKVLDIFHYNRGMGFGELMADAISALPEGDRSQVFALEGGMTATLTVKEMTMPGAKYNGVTRIDLRPRKKDYSEEMLESIPCLDSMLVDIGEEKMEELLSGGVGTASEPKRSAPASKNGEEEEDDAPLTRGKSTSAGKPPSKKDSTDNEEEDNPAAKKELKVGDIVIYTDEYEGEIECEIKKISGDGTSLILENEDGDLIKAVDPDDVEPVKKKPQASGKPSKRTPDPDEEEEDSDLDSSLDDDEDEDEDEEEEEEKPQSRSRKGKR